VAIPPLGAGLGGLDWREVRPRIEAAFGDLVDVRILLFEPTGAPASSQMSHAQQPPKMTVGRAALVGLMQRYLAAVMDPVVSLLEIHKLMYFMQEAGEPLRLRYTKGHYGPYVENLRHVLSEIEGHLIVGYGDGGDKPEKPIELAPGAADWAAEFLRGHPVTEERFGRVVNLIEGFETPFGMELLATVHWVATRESAADVEAATKKVYAWSSRKSMFSLEQLSVAWQTLSDKGWLSVASDKR
jgi:O-acetyl-ADP-ribose deacetylase (regulator of RNase III)